MRIRPQFGIRTLLVMLLLTALGLLLWQSIPTHGKPILYGQIVDTTGAPIPNVQVILHWGLVTHFPQQTMKTDSRGKFRFAPLETGTIVNSENGGFDTLLVGVCVAHSEYRAADGADWWDIYVPLIKNRKYPWNLEMTKVFTDNED